MKWSKEFKRNYDNVHQWLKYHYGKAQKCEATQCPGISKSYDWALIKGKEYEKKRENFMSLCHSCHKKYDFTEKGRQQIIAANQNIKKTHCKYGHEYTKENTYVYKNKHSLLLSRYCRICVRERRREFDGYYKRNNKIKVVSGEVTTD